MASRYFNLLFSGSLIVITPFWSAFTDAWHRNDRVWMYNTLHKLERFCIVAAVIGAVMVAISGRFYHIWIGDQVQVDLILTAAVGFYTIITVIGNLYTYLIAGLGTIQIQMTIYLISALIAWPLLTFSCRLGTAGIVVFPTLVYLVQAIAGRIQLGRLLSGKATGIWAK